jgi:hypothetical protein
VYNDKIMNAFSSVTGKITNSLSNLFYGVFGGGGGGADRFNPRAERARDRGARNHSADEDYTGGDERGGGTLENSYMEGGTFSKH